MQSKPLNLPWHQHDHYWIGLFARGGNFTPQVAQALKNAGLQFFSAGVMGAKTDRHWKLVWDAVYAAINQLNAAHLLMASVTPADVDSPMQTRTSQRSIADMQSIADGMWLGDAMMEDRVVCYLQPVVVSKEKTFGYESFARVKEQGGKVKGGDEIISASRALGMEFQIDRLLQIQAIKTFVSSDYNGFLFINFLPGFIHRPSVYLEGLSETVKSQGIIAKNIVLEFTKSETPRDLSHLRSVCEYGRSKGYSIALDDISTLEGARKLFTEVKPDFVKIDRKLGHRSEDSRAAGTIRQIVETVHAGGGSVIGEGIETEENYRQLKALGVDLFQGYYFSPPVPVEKALPKSAAVGN